MDPYAAKTMPPLNDSRISLGTAPDQKAKTLSSLKIWTAQFKVLRYTLRASMDCILVQKLVSGRSTKIAEEEHSYRVLIVSNGIVTYLKLISMRSVWMKILTLHCDYASHCTNAKRAEGSNFLSRSDISLSNLPQSRITSEANA